MDLRQQRTKRNITNAFLKLRSQKPLEKITIKELAEKADIHKATFYLHYHDIYELSEMLEWEVIHNILNGLSDPTMLLTDTERFGEELYYFIMSYDSILEILFSDSRAGMFTMKLEKCLKEYIFARKPDWDTLEMNVILTCLVHGGYHTYVQYKHAIRKQQVDLKQITLMINKIAGSVLSMYTQENQSQ